MIDKIVRFFFSFIFERILKKQYTEEQHSVILQFVKFGIVGVSNTVLSYALYVMALWLLRKMVIMPDIDYLVAQIIAFILSVLWSYYWNEHKVFTLKAGQKRSRWKALLKTYVSYSFTGLFLNSVLLFLWINWIGISEYIAPIINLLISVPLNFLINKFWAFKGE